jgi:hypothetical protein
MRMESGGFKKLQSWNRTRRQDAVGARHSLARVTLHGVGDCGVAVLLGIAGAVERLFGDRTPFVGLEGATSMLVIIQLMPLKLEHTA